jgi:ferredoxin, 2Fe-2S
VHPHFFVFMPIIRIPKLKKELEVPSGTILFEALREADIPIASSCQGELVCGRCKLRILSGNENLTEVTAVETRMTTRLAWANESSKLMRAACGCAIVAGSVEIATDYW